MIGVVCSSSEKAAVEEFFQLFKTPWEFHQSSRTYEVVLVTTDEIPRTTAKLVLSYGATGTRADEDLGIASIPLQVGAELDAGGTRVPIYCGGRVFRQSGNGLLRIYPKIDNLSTVGDSSGSTVLRVGYDLFREIEFLLTEGQPPQNAGFPTLELHISVLRNCVLNAGIPLVEIPPSPSGCDFIACLTHDIDFVGIRRHKFDHTMWGFLYRSSVGAVQDFLRKRISLGRLLKMWRAATSLPFVYLGWMEDYWMPFRWYLEVEKGIPATYYLIPFKHRAGEHVTVPHAERRGTAYDIADLPEWVSTLLAKGNEVGVHGIDSWHDVSKGRQELHRVRAMTGQAETGIRMHWLLRDEKTFSILDEAGYAYDSTAGFNETVGYRCGTTQAFRPLGVSSLMELPMHIQDGALFYPGRLGLSESDAWQRCLDLVEKAKSLGGVVTVLWHDRSHGPERFWGEFYHRLVEELKSKSVWFASGGQVVGWFRERRAISFEQADCRDGMSKLRLRGKSAKIDPPLRVRLHRGSPVQATSLSGSETNVKVTEMAWDGEEDLVFENLTDLDPTHASFAGQTE